MTENFLPGPTSVQRHCYFVPLQILGYSSHIYSKENWILAEKWKSAAKKKAQRVRQLESFGWILLNLKFISVIGTVPTYLVKWEKRVNFGNGVAEIQQKYKRERGKVRERKFWILAMLPKFLLEKKNW